jgi:hypothetical protein
VGVLKPFSSTNLRIGLTNPSKTVLGLSGKFHMHQSQKGKANRFKKHFGTMNKRFISKKWLFRRLSGCSLLRMEGKSFIHHKQT